MRFSDIGDNGGRAAEPSAPLARVRLRLSDCPDPQCGKSFRPDWQRSDQPVLGVHGNGGQGSAVSLTRLDNILTIENQTRRAFWFVSVASREFKGAMRAKIHDASPATLPLIVSAGVMLTRSDSNRV